MFRINSEINVAAGAECIRFAYQPVVVQRDAMLMTRVERRRWSASVQVVS